MSEKKPECETNHDVRLVPVLELEPYGYASKERQSLGSDATPDERERHFLGSLADAGITGVTPISPGSWCVPLAQLTDISVLEKILRVERCHDDEDDAEECFPNDPENTIALNGGYALMVNGNVEITPRCCGDLSDLDNWRDATAHRSPEKTDVWIGHPWIYVHFDGNYLCFTDSTNEGAVEWEGEIRLVPELLEAAVERAEQEIVAFAEILLPVVAMLTPPGSAEDATENLAGLA